MKVNHGEVRQFTKELIRLLDEGILNKDEVIKACLNHMSEDEVQDMAESNEFIEVEEDEEEEEEEEEENDEDEETEEDEK